MRARQTDLEGESSPNVLPERKLRTLEPIFLYLSQKECQKLLLENPALASKSNFRGSFRGLFGLFQALYSAPEQLAVHVKILNLWSISRSYSSQHNELLSLLHLMPDLTKLKLS